MKYIFVTGGVVSSLGKGLAAAGIRAGVRATILFGTNAASDAMESGATVIARDFGEVVEFILGH